MAGRPFIHGVAAFGEAGGAHVATLLANDLANAMIQIGAASLSELRKADVRISGAWQ
jgi:isopentenyl diphosphate isomerase/L-lactate dehydrogenase-like FMN-dependent dehydrogenase